MRLRYIKACVWLSCVFVANVIVYTVVTLSRRPLSLQASGRSAFIGGHLRLWQHRDFHGLPLWDLLLLYMDRLENPILRNATSQFNLTLPGTCGESFHEASQRLADFSSYPSQLQAFILSMHCRDYPLLIGPADDEACPDGTQLLVAVRSQMANFDRRQAIRQTWGRTGLVRNVTVQTLFLLGRQGSGDGHPDLEALLELERQKNRDLLLWDFQDTFYNLSLKDILFLGWLRGHCPSVEVIFLGYDDVFLRVETLVDYAGNFDAITRRGLFAGHVIQDAAPVHDSKHKYYVPESFYQGTYPPYVGGGGILCSRDVATQLYEASCHLPLFPIGNIFLGICLRELALVPLNHPGFWTFNMEAEGQEDLCAYKELILVDHRTPQDIIRLWRGLHDPALAC
ncbi:N-acetyllactosaminide beta-1,3-N-acetylglucosaminyltransferase 2-like [Mauremys reevesii]|uniref:N-acetyllactosaminide beta-1,3-N-acetylglucosaminyltransferase 2-like n=1 Tax=Mauremys reevesii TaxID=260615 RepID=UPI00193EC6E6|nr:N-acetyllactosaminide beta-1,3-N-acetylglucosaminyltransferase 2-like [Mauremys reevesii]